MLTTLLPIRVVFLTVSESLKYSLRKRWNEQHSIFISSASVISVPEIGLFGSLLKEMWSNPYPISQSKQNPSSSLFIIEKDMTSVFRQLKNIGIWFIHIDLRSFPEPVSDFFFFFLSKIFNWSVFFPGLTKAQ